MDRKEMIDFIIAAIWEIEEADVHPHEYWDYTDEQLKKEAEFYEYLLSK